MTASQLQEVVRKAWSATPAPPEKDMEFMEWGWGENAARAFTGVAPVDVDIQSPGFHAATPLFDLPPRAAAAYLGTFLLSLLREMQLQAAIGFFGDVVTRAHTLTCLTNKRFWHDVIRKHLSPECQRAVEAVAIFLAANPEALFLNQDQVATLQELATDSKT